MTLCDRDGDTYDEFDHATIPFGGWRESTLPGTGDDKKRSIEIMDVVIDRRHASDVD